MRVKLSTATNMAAPMDSHELSTGWEFKQAGTDEWMPVRRVPTNVHLDLMDNKKYILC